MMGCMSIVLHQQGLPRPRLCSQKLIDARPGRREPRATKRRPQSYQLLTNPRHIFSEIPRRGNYYKKA